MKVFFGGLNELRAVAAFSVVVHHVELYKARSGFPSLFDTSLAPLVMFLGEHGVNLFFVLSGFLITYLLLVERDDRGRIDTMRFYVRRTLRIWPLYYLLVLVTFFVVPFLAQSVPALRQETFYYSWIERMTETSTFSLILLFALSAQHRGAGESACRRSLTGVVSRRRRAVLSPLASDCALVQAARAVLRARRYHRGPARFQVDCRVF
ncbi:MAG: acyltransferase [Planctomycetaceae bacterium]|nr:acyltransferase [Planctomycetaceae bacterium]